MINNPNWLRDFHEFKYGKQPREVGGEGQQEIGDCVTGPTDDYWFHIPEKIRLERPDWRRSAPWRRCNLRTTLCTEIQADSRASWLPVTQLLLLRPSWAAAPSLTHSDDAKWILYECAAIILVSSLIMGRIAVSHSSLPLAFGQHLGQRCPRCIGVRVTQRPKHICEWDTAISAISTIRTLNLLAYLRSLTTHAATKSVFVETIRAKPSTRIIDWRILYGWGSSLQFLF